MNLSRNVSSIQAAIALTTALCFHGPTALACSCDHLAHGFIGPETTRLPANAIGIPWFVSTGQRARRPWNEHRFAVAEDRFTVEILDAGTFREVPFDIGGPEEFARPFSDTFLIYHIVPRDGGLRPGASYRVSDRVASERDRERQVLVTVDREVLSDDATFTLEVGSATTESISVAVDDGSCGAGLEVSQAKITATLPDEAQKWRDQLLFRTFVDGNPWDYRSSYCDRIEPGSAADGRGRDRVFVACQEPSFGRYLTSVSNQGGHTVMVQARLPGTDIVLKTAVGTVDLACPDSNLPGG